MSKIKVDNLEGYENVKLSPNGTGVVEVKGAGGEDGTLKLFSDNGTNAVKIKSPPHSAGQSYTLTLPDNNITQDAFIKVKSVTGSGSTATGQLEYASVSEPDLTNLNADNLTSGTVPAARFPSSFAATDTAFKLISYTVIPAGQSISLITLDWSSYGDGAYFFTGNLEITNQYGNPEIYMKDSGGNYVYSHNLKFETDAQGNTSNSYGYSFPQFADGGGAPNPMNTTFTGQISTYDHGTGANTFMFQLKGFHKHQAGGRYELYMRNSYTNNNARKPTTLSFNATLGNFHQESYIILYKYLNT